MSRNHSAEILAESGLGRSDNRGGERDAGRGAMPAVTFDPAGFNVRHMFATPVVIAPIKEAAVLNVTLLAAILGRAATSVGVARSNLGGWQSSDDFVGWSGAAGEALVKAATELADRLTAVQAPGGLAQFAPAWRIDAWANVNHAGDANAPHHHGGSFWSAAYWVDAGDPGQGGEFEMQDPRGILPNFSAPHLRMALPGCLSAGGSDFLDPVTGTLVLFPSWMVHAVRPYRGRRPRVSVAFNFSAG